MADLPESPITRQEQYLAAVSGQTSQIPEHPITRVEQYLEYIATHGSSGGGEGGTSNYNELVHKPKINGVELSGDKTPESLGLAVQDDIDNLSETVSNKAAQADLDTVIAEVSALQASLSALSETLNTVKNSMVYPKSPT